jgi:elongation factor G
MFVPEPVISLALKPKGQETPNFSRALNRFKREDPTFRVHLDHESKEVELLFEVLLHVDPPSRLSSLEWENSILKFTLRE